MNVIGVIPARYHSTRFEGKVLATLAGKSMVQHVWEQAKKSYLLEDLIVACDDERVYKAVEAFGGKAVLTAKGHASGTERIVEVVNPLDVKVVVNIQADEPMIHPSMINRVVEALLEDETLVCASVMKKIERSQEVDDPNVVKVVFDKSQFALYFSRQSIPFIRDTSFGDAIHYKHIGLYGYTKDFLFTYKALPKSNLENLEKLEQLRILENGYRIKLIETTHETFGVDTEEDLEKVRHHL